jgi:hypothetical protein
MGINRRYFIQKTLGVLSCFGTTVFGIFPFSTLGFYTFKVTMKSNEDFSCPKSRYWEDQTGLEGINNRYFNDGRLLSLYESHDKKLNVTQWTYIFIDKKSFKDWDSEVLSTGLFKANKLPKSVQYKVSEFQS